MMKHYKDADLNIFGIDDGQEDLVMDGWVEITEAERDQIIESKKPAPTADELRAAAMLTGADYNGQAVSLTAADGNGMLQAKAAFEMGLTETVIHFENGAEVPVTAAEFPDFALWFVTERNKFFAP
ncbi:MAG: hypothetical protein C0613_08240 [Desulfobulbaceae bacterium]|nr:MAG: hypothetical protein C0613_08240 [Desulfobulbaceae bacterium]